MSRVRTLALATCFAPACAPPATAQQGEVWQAVRVTSGIDISSGDYGAAMDTDIVYVPVKLSYDQGPVTLDLTVPYLHVNGPAFVVDGAALADLPTRPDGGQTADGLGDITFGMTYALEQYWDRGLFIDLGVAVKIPTASFDKGLGTGKADLGLTVDGAMKVGNWLPFAQVGYRFTGSPTAFALRDVLMGSVGAQYSFSERTRWGVSIDARQSSVRGRTAPVEAMSYLNVRLTSHISVNMYGVAGLTENSPDVGGGLQIIWRSQ